MPRVSSLRTAKGAGTWGGGAQLVETPVPSPRRAFAENPSAAPFTGSTRAERRATIPGMIVDLADDSSSLRGFFSCPLKAG